MLPEDFKPADLAPEVIRQRVRACAFGSAEVTRGAPLRRVGLRAAQRAVDALGLPLDYLLRGFSYDLPGTYVPGEHIEQGEQRCLSIAAAATLAGLAVRERMAQSGA
ncbi:MAG: hypothetical protein QM765_47370 [Myxococcales bacterium]